MSFFISSSPQGQELDVLEPAGGAVVLESDVALTGVVLVGDVELVGRAVGATVGGGPLVEVRAGDGLPVERDGDPRAVAGDDHVVPLAGGLHGVGRGLDQV